MESSNDLASEDFAVVAGAVVADLAVIACCIVFAFVCCKRYKCKWMRFEFARKRTADLDICSVALPEHHRNHTTFAQRGSVSTEMDGDAELTMHGIEADNDNDDEDEDDTQYVEQEEDDDSVLSKDGETKLGMLRESTPFKLEQQRGRKRPSDVLELPPLIPRMQQVFSDSETEMDKLSPSMTRKQHEHTHNIVLPSAMTGGTKGGTQTSMRRRARTRPKKKRSRYKGKAKVSRIHDLMHTDSANATMGSPSSKRIGARISITEYEACSSDADGDEQEMALNMHMAMASVSVQKYQSDREEHAETSVVATNACSDTNAAQLGDAHSDNHVYTTTIDVNWDLEPIVMDADSAYSVVEPIDPDAISSIDIINEDM